MPFGREAPVKIEKIRTTRQRFVKLVFAKLLRFKGSGYEETMAQASRSFCALRWCCFVWAELGAAGFCGHIGRFAGGLLGNCPSAYAGTGDFRLQFHVLPRL
ncbi:hypothetical protein SDC9_160638 [bioreactor metagenome]|uniref:Uncharacterized protein n=1 Tax=bioreactor metagenome TaxID=1076179 RepID=A0A645FG60_9ZZZZ